MKHFFSIGRFLAFLVALFLAYYCFGLVFAQGGTGSNILLGIILVFFGVQYVTKNLGNYLDDHFFHGGSQERALLVRQSLQEIEESKVNLKKSRKKNASTEENHLENYKNALLELRQCLDTIQSNWASASEVVHSQIAALKKMLHLVKTAKSQTFDTTKGRSWFEGVRSLLSILLIALGVRAFIAEPFQIPSGSMIPTFLVGDHLFVWKLSYGIPNPFSSPPSYFVRWSSPQPGEIVVFQAPPYVGQNAGQPWIKRVIAKEGQTVAVKNNMVYVNEIPYPDVAPPEVVNYMDYFGDGRQGEWLEQKAVLTKEKIGSLEHTVYLPYEHRRTFFYDPSNWPPPEREFYPGLTCHQNACKVQPGYVFVMGDNRGNSKDSRAWGALPIGNVKGNAKIVWMSVDGSQLSANWGKFQLPSIRWNRLFLPIH